MKKLMSGLLAAGLTYSLTFSSTVLAKNPITDKMFTADPAAMVHDGTVYLYTGHDEDTDNKFYKMNDWLLFTSTDMVNWQEHPPIMKVTDFKWAKEHAWAAHMIERDGKFVCHGNVLKVLGV